jgi:hypothetical protein
MEHVVERDMKTACEIFDRNERLWSILSPNMFTLTAMRLKCDVLNPRF